MARADAKKPAKPQAKGRVVAGSETLPFGKKSRNLFAVGFLMILVGYFLLSKNDITIAPLLLVGGYCVVIPLAILAK